MVQDRFTGLTSASATPICSWRPRISTATAASEIPAPEQACPKADTANTAAAKGLVKWISYDKDGDSASLTVTYHDLAAGWYFRLPDG